MPFQKRKWCSEVVRQRMVGLAGQRIFVGFLSTIQRMIRKTEGMVQANNHEDFGILVIQAMIRCLCL
ncbi:hypothetical protein B4U80_09168, partial [Leptotrombidium deliense]